MHGHLSVITIANIMLDCRVHFLRILQNRILMVMAVYGFTWRAAYAALGGGGGGGGGGGYYPRSDTTTDTVYKLRSCCVINAAVCC